MFCIRKPTQYQLQRFYDTQQQLTFSYPYDVIGATREQTPPGYDPLHYRVCLGSGQAVFEAAQAALLAWRQFPSGLAEIYPANAALQAGTTVVVVLRALGLWKLASCRIVYTLDDCHGDESGGIQQFGFAYGTLPGHVEQGEERFAVQWNRNDNTVWYDLKSFSRPATLLVWLGMPLARYFQNRFAIQSARAMLKAVHDQLGHANATGSASCARQENTA